MFQSPLDRQHQFEKEQEREEEREMAARAHERGVEDFARAKSYFLANHATPALDAATLELDEEIGPMITDQMGLEHLRTRWGLKYFFTDSQQAARKFDTSPEITLADKVSDLFEGEATNDKITAVGIDADEAYGIHFRALAEDGWHNYQIMPVASGDRVVFRIASRDDNGGRDDSYVEDKEGTIEMVRKTMCNHIDLQRSPLRTAFHVGSAIAAAALVAVNTMGNLFQDGNRPQDFTHS